MTITHITIKCKTTHHTNTPTQNSQSKLIRLVRILFSIISTKQEAIIYLLIYIYQPQKNFILITKC